MATRTWQGGTVDYATAGNWVEGSVPTAGDAVYIKPHPTTGVSWDITTSLNQSAVAIASFASDPQYTGTIGSDDGSAYLQINTAGNVRLWGTGSESIDMSAAAVADIDVRSSSTSTGVRYLKGGVVGSSTRALVLRAHQGTVTWVSGDCVKVYVSYLDAVSGGCTFTWLAGTMAGTGAVTFVMGGSLDQRGGTLLSPIIVGGDVTIHDGAFADALVHAGTMDYRSTTAAGTIQVNNQAELTFANDIRPKTVTKIIAAGRCTVNVDNPNLTVTNGIETIGSPTIITPTTQRAVGIA